MKFLYTLVASALLSSFTPSVQASEKLTQSQAIVWVAITAAFTVSVVTDGRAEVISRQEYSKENLYGELGADFGAFLEDATFGKSADFLAAEYGAGDRPTVNAVIAQIQAAE